MEQIYQPSDIELQRQNQLLQERLKTQRQHTAQRNLVSQKARQKATEKIVARAVTSLTGGLGLPVGIIAGKLAGKLGLSGFTKIALLGIGIAALSPFFIILFLPLLPLVFVVGLMGTVYLFVKN